MTKSKPVADESRPDRSGTRAMTAGIVVGLIGFAAAAGVALGVDGASDRFPYSYLVAYTYYLSLALGALFFVLLQHLTRSGWSVVVRRPAEALAGTMPLFVILVVPLWRSMDHLYPWAAVHGETAAGPNAAYLNAPFFIGRIFFYLVVGGVLARFFLATSLRQDATGEADLTRRMERVSARGRVLHLHPDRRALAHAVRHRVRSVHRAALAGGGGRGQGGVCDGPHPALLLPL